MFPEQTKTGYVLKPKYVQEINMATIKELLGEAYTPEVKAAIDGAITAASEKAAAEAVDGYKEIHNGKLERLQSQLDKAEKDLHETGTKLKEYTGKEFKDVIKTKLTEAGLLEDKLEIALKRAGITADSSEEDITKGIEEYKTDFPTHFTVVESGGAGGASDSTPKDDNPFLKRRKQSKYQKPINVQKWGLKTPLKGIYEYKKGYD